MIKNIFIACVVITSVLGAEFESSKPILRDIGEKNIVSGVVYAKDEQVVSTRNSGLITDIKVQEGDIVRKDEVLVRIDPIELSTKISSAKSNLDIKESTLDSANTNLLKAETDLAIKQRLYDESKKDLKRFKNLFDNGVLSKRDFDKKLLETSITEDNLKIAKHNYKVAKNQVQMAKSGLHVATSGLRSVKNELKYTYLKSQFDGVVVKKFKNKNEIAMPAESILKIASLKNLRVEARVQESHISSIDIGDRVTIEIPSLNKNIEAIVAIKSSQGDPLTHTYMVKFDIATKGLLPGMYAKVYIVSSSKKMLTVLPTSLIVKGGIVGVFVKKEKELLFKDIEILYKGVDFIGVKGIEATDEVICYPKAGYYDGMRL